VLLVLYKVMMRVSPYYLDIEKEIIVLFLKHSSY